MARGTQIIGWVIGGLMLALPRFVAAAPKPLPASPSIRHSGTAYHDVHEVAGRFQLKTAWLRPGEAIRLQSAWTTLDLRANRQEMRINDVQVYLGNSVAAKRGRLFVAQHDLDSLIVPILLRRGRSAPPVVKTIVLDPGHGGNDRGNENRKFGLVEKRFTLDVARRLAVLLRARGFRVVLTRTNDRRLELDDRIDIATAAHADLFVSIHFNSFGDAAVSGAETYIMTPQFVHSAPALEHDTTMRTTMYPGNDFDPWNAVLGYEIHRQLVGTLQAEDRGLKRYRYYVLRMVDCPAVLVEPGFLSNSAEGRKVNTRGYRAQIARALCNGIVAYAACVKKAR